MVELLATINHLLGSELASKAAAQLGECEGSVQKALGSLVPLVLGSLIKRTETPGSAQATLRLSQQAYNTVGGRLATPGSLLSLLSGSSELGSSWLGTLFGGAVGLGTITSALGSYAGISQSSADALLQLVGPAVLGLLGQKAVNSNLNAGGFAVLLGGLKNEAQTRLPTGLSSLTGLLGLDNLGTPSDALGSLGGSRPRPSADRPRVAVPPAGGSSRWPLVLLAVVALAALLYFLRSCDKGREAALATPAWEATAPSPR